MSIEKLEVRRITAKDRSIDPEDQIENKISQHRARIKKDGLFREQLEHKKGRCLEI